MSRLREQNFLKGFFHILEKKLRNFRETGWSFFFIPVTKHSKNKD